MLTVFEKQILSLASLLCQPFHAGLIARVLNKPERGVINVLGRLAGKSRVTRSIEKHTFYLKETRDPPPDSEVSQQQVYRKIWKVISGTSGPAFFRTMPAYHRAFYAIRAGVPEADAVAAGCLNDAMNRADDFSFNRIASCCRSHWGEALPGVILEIINEHQRLTTTVCGPWDPEVDKIFRLQEAGMVTPARKAMESTGIPDTEDADRQALIAWLRGRQAVLEERLDDAKRDWLNCLKLLKWRKHRHLAAEIMLDLARVHGIQQEFARETRCIRIAEYMVRNSRRPGLVERSHIRIMESALEKGNLQQVIARITAVLQPMGFEEDSRQLALVCCYGLIVAGRMDKPLQALYYGRELMQLRDAIPFEYLGRCRLAMEELRSWQPDMTESGINALLAREAEVLAEFENHPPETGGFSDGILRFFRFSQCLCDRVTMNAGVDDDAPREHNAERLKEAMRLAQGIGDERRWSRLARQLSRRKDGDIPDDPEYPPGYFKWLNRWTQSDTRETLIAMIATGMERMFGITRGFFLELRNGVWQWLDTWGTRPEIHIRRSILRNLDSACRRDFSGTSGWTVLPYPDGEIRRGFLGVGLNPHRTGEREYNETVTYLELILKPLLVIRSGIRPAPFRAPANDTPHISDAADRILGISPEIEQLRKDIRNIAGSPSTVHIRGETGTGKELVARAIHLCSDRKTGPFVAFNCATCPETMIESELFGHVRGAFTGALKDRRGVFLSAHGGTVFLDEVADLPLNTQAKLLRIIQERRVRALGSDDEQSVDIRIISATHRDLHREMSAGKFRDDLFYRLVVINLHIPPLFRRRMDIAYLAEHFLEKTAVRMNRDVPRLDASAYKWLGSYSWPGNIRELQNIMEVVVNYADPDCPVTGDDLRAWTHHLPQSFLPTLSEITDRAQRIHIEDVLRFCDWNNTRAATILGISRQALFKKMKSLGIINRDD